MKPPCAAKKLRNSSIVQVTTQAVAEAGLQGGQGSGWKQESMGASEPGTAKASQAAGPQFCRIKRG